MEKKKIFIAADIFPPEIGGPATYASRLADELHGKGYVVRVLHYGHFHVKKHTDRYKIYKVSKRWPLPVRYIIYALKLFIFSYNFDVIYAQGPVSAGLPALWVSRLTDKRLVVKVVGDYAWEQAQVAKCTGQTIDEWQKKPAYKAKFIDKIKTMIWAEKKVVSNADKVITPSHYLKNVVIGWGAKEENVEVVYNSVESIESTKEMTKEEAKKETGLSGDILISVGRFVPWKGFGFLIRLMPELLKINPDFKLVLAGDGPEYKRYKQLVVELNLLDKVIFTGSIKREKLAVYLKSSCMFLLASSYEGLSHLILEAMKENTPVVASNVGGNSEIVDDDINGLLIPYMEKDAWLEAIKKVWSDDDFRKRISTSPIPNMPCFDFDEMIGHIEKILTE